MKDKKGFTLIELIAVVVILSILAIIATPNIVNMIDSGKKEQYVADAKDFIAKATYMYKQKDQERYQGKFSNNTIKLGDIEGINDSDLTDPYGYTYDKENSIIKFEEPSSPDTEVVQERIVKITLYSYEEDKCYMIENIEKNKLSKSDVQLGTYSNGICSK